MSTAKLTAEGLKETRILISTDVLSEGLNLQDATRLINYDLHWNPVRLMQRIGRVDRRMDPGVEELSRPTILIALLSAAWSFTGTSFRLTSWTNC